VHAAMPKSVEHYQQETGRAGRDGLPSECVLLFSGGDFLTLKAVVEKSAEEAGAAPEFLAASLKHLDEMSNYCRRAVCRPRARVGNLARAAHAEMCGACDSARGHTGAAPDGTPCPRKTPSGAGGGGETFGTTPSTDVPRGATPEAARPRRHDQLSTYGLLKDV